MADNMNKLISELSKKLGVSENNIKNAVQNGNVDNILKSSNTSQAKQVESILSDPEKTKKLLNSPQAKALMKLLGEDKNQDK